MPLSTKPAAAQTRMPPLREPPVPPVRGTARPGPLSSLCYAALRWAGALGPALVTSVHPGLCPRPQLPARAAGGARESGRKGRRTQVSVIIPARSGRRARGRASVLPRPARRAHANGRQPRRRSPAPPRRGSSASYAMHATPAPKTRGRSRPRSASDHIGSDRSLKRWPTILACDPNHDPSHMMRKRSKK